VAPPALRTTAASELGQSARDRQLLGFAAEHRLVLEAQLEQLGEARPRGLAGRLARLVERGYLSTGCVFGQRHYQIRRAGLEAVGCRLPVPRFQLGAYKHDVGVAWLWLAARRGTFGPLRTILGERRLRSHDRRAERPDEPYGIRLGGADAHGGERLHYPDLLLVDPWGRQLAVELELTPKSQARRELILGGYGAERRIDVVLYVVEDDARGRAIRRLVARSAHDMGLGDRVAIQPIRPLRLAGEPDIGRGGRSTRRGAARPPALTAPGAVR
jgi:hypothetical protein